MTIFGIELRLKVDRSSELAGRDGSKSTRYRSARRNSKGSNKETMAPQSRVLFGRKAEGQPGGEGERRTALSCDDEGGVMFSCMVCGKDARG